MPASILSGIILYSVPCRLLTPFINNVLFDVDFIFAPAEIKKLIKSKTSGSIAIFFNLTSLLDKQLFRIAVSVAPTDIFLNKYESCFLNFFFLDTT